MATIKDYEYAAIIQTLHLYITCNYKFYEVSFAEIENDFTNYKPLAHETKPILDNFTKMSSSELYSRIAQKKYQYHG
jgi:hypothetical protein